MEHEHPRLYYKRSLAMECVDDAMEEYGLKRSDITSKWGNLRGQFLRDYNRHEKTKTSGSGEADDWKSSWKWYKALEFLKTGEVS